MDDDDFGGFEVCVLCLAPVTVTRYRNAFASIVSWSVLSVCVAAAACTTRVPAAQRTTTWVSSLVLLTILFKDKVFHWPGTCQLGYAGWLASKPQG